MHHIRNTSEAFGILAVLAMAALHCLSEASLQKQSSIGAQPKKRKRKLRVLKYDA